MNVTGESKNVAELRESLQERLCRSVACLICGSADAATVSTRARFDLPVRNVICTACGLVYVNPRFSPQGLAEYYRNEFRNRSNSAHLNTEAFRLLKEQKVRIIEQIVPVAGRVLEIGCSSGVLLKELRRVRPDARVCGVEPTPELAAMARASGLEVSCGMFGEFDPGPALFDLVIMEHTLEHIDDPLDTLSRVRRMLKPRGMVYVEVPDILHPYGDLDRNFFQLAHLYSFSCRTLPLLMRKAGLQPLVVRSGKTGIMAIAGRAEQPQQADPRQGDDFRRVMAFLSEYRRRFREQLSAAQHRKGE